MTQIEVTIAPVALPHPPRETFARWHRAAPGVLLESASPTPGAGDWSYITGPARAILHANAQGTWLEGANGERRQWVDPFDALADVMRPDNVVVRGLEVAPPGLDFVGGWAGALGYDTARHLHRISTLPRWGRAGVGASGVPSATLYWLQTDQVLAYHHLTRQWWQCLTSRNGAPAQGWPLGPARRRSVARGAWSARDPQLRMTQAEFEAGVVTLKDAIARGDLLQANLTRREDFEFEGDAFALYDDLVRAHPAPFCAFVQAPDFAIASCSPERFLKLRDGLIEARPIKGTVPRGATEAEDLALRDALTASEKDRAENLMITDLMRNDLGRVAQTGSVRVDKLFDIEPHPGVWQMVSTIHAQLRDGLTTADLLRATWPPGSMTGAPKLAAMRAIDALEPVRRGFYAGSIGYLDCRGGLDLSVVIRSVIVANGCASLQLGGGIVADSTASGEWNETVAKGERLRAILSRSAPFGSP